MFEISVSALTAGTFVTAFTSIVFVSVIALLLIVLLLLTPLFTDLVKLGFRSVINLNPIIK